jgi:hypothetical protein
MIPAGIMSIFVDGGADWFLSDKSSRGERNHGGHRPDKRNILSHGAPRSGRNGKIKALDRQ